ncbi:MAG: hypothetical protein M3347_10200, partial [Armatimonadota bacterium]|nr:hypothetical protein [Armatimonadota bacterium]
MSLIEDVRQTLTGAAETVAERGQQLTEIARLQLAVKRLQLERARRLHDLGTRIYALYKGGASLAEPLPAEVLDVCRQIEDAERQIAETQEQLKVVREKVKQNGAGESVDTSAGADEQTTAIVPVEDSSQPAADAPAAPSSG